MGVVDEDLWLTRSFGLDNGKIERWISESIDAPRNIKIRQSLPFLY